MKPEKKIRFWQGFMQEERGASSRKNFSIICYQASFKLFNDTVSYR
nr:MAG TPA: hypothetical protein [Caudoviricetes sp.]